MKKAYLLLALATGFSAGMSAMNTTGAGKEAEQVPSLDQIVDFFTQGKLPFHMVSSFFHAQEDHITEEAADTFCRNSYYRTDLAIANRLKKQEADMVRNSKAPAGIRTISKLQELSFNEIENICSMLWILCKYAQKKGTSYTYGILYSKIALNFFSHDLFKAYIEQAIASGEEASLNEGLQATRLAELLLNFDFKAKSEAGGIGSSEKDAARTYIAEKKQCLIEELEDMTDDEDDENDSSDSIATKNRTRSGFSLRRLLPWGAAVLGLAVIAVATAFVYQKYGTKKPQQKAQI